METASLRETEMSTTSGLVVPIAMWGRRAPTHCVTVLYLLRDQKTLVTGSADGQVLCMRKLKIYDKKYLILDDKI